MRLLTVTVVVRADDSDGLALAVDIDSELDIPDEQIREIAASALSRAAVEVEG